MLYDRAANEEAIPVDYGVSTETPQDLCDGKNALTQ